MNFNQHEKAKLKACAHKMKNINRNVLLVFNPIVRFNVLPRFMTMNYAKFHANLMCLITQSN